MFPPCSYFSHDMQYSPYRADYYQLWYLSEADVSPMLRGLWGNYVISDVPVMIGNKIPRSTNDGYLLLQIMYVAFAGIKI
jgi:hypothetical protein